MTGKKKYRPFDWLSYLFDKEEQTDTAEAEETAVVEVPPEVQEAVRTGTSKGRKKTKRKGIDDEDPVSFRTATGPISVQQAVYYAVRDLLYSAGPMFVYIVITFLCVILGYPLTGMGRGTFAEYIAERSNPLVALGVLLTFRYLFKKSKKNGSAFFEDASLYIKKASVKKIFMGLIFGAGAALFLSAVLTLIPKVWVFAVYDSQVQRIYKRYDIALTIIESAVLTPLVEEIVFRGYMLNRLLRRWADLPAIIVTTLIFSVMHGTSIWIIYAFVMGWLIGKLSIMEGNILYGIFVHAGFNLPSVIMWFYYLFNPSKQGQMTPAGVLQTILTGLAGIAAAALVYVLYMRMRRTVVMEEIDHG